MLDDIISDLEGAGYAVQTFDIPAIALDAKHIRHRLFIVAHSDGSGRWLNNTGRCGAVAHAEVIPIGAGLREGEPTGQWRGRFGDTSSAGEFWAVEPGVGRVAHGVPHRVDRLRGLGNAVVPQVAEFVGRMILESER